MTAGGWAVGLVYVWVGCPVCVDTSRTCFWWVVSSVDGFVICSEVSNLVLQTVNGSFGVSFFFFPLPSVCRSVM